MLHDILVILILSVMGIAAFKLINFPSVPGYLVAGLLAGENAFGLIHDPRSIEQVAGIKIMSAL